MRVALDGFISAIDELFLWRAGHQVPVRAETSEEDIAWLIRAKHDAVRVVVTQDKGAARTAYNMGFDVILFDGQIKGMSRKSDEILYQLRVIESAQDDIQLSA